MNIDVTVFDRPTPWQASATLEDFFEKGGRCLFSDPCNWLGVIFSCALRANPNSGVPGDSSVRFAWANLAIAVSESLASTSSDADVNALLEKAMSVRINMISVFGNHPGDRVCDAAKVIEFYMSVGVVKELLKNGVQSQTIIEIHPDARIAGEALILLKKGNIDLTEDARKLLKLLEIAKNNPLPPGGLESLFAKIGGGKKS